MAVVILAWVVVASVINPVGNFPINDDWAFALPVKAMVQDGAFRLTDWQGMTLVTQTLWGSIFCLPGGFSFTTLRISSLVLAVFIPLGCYRLMKASPARTAIVWIGVLAVAANPLFVPLSFTFMTDIPFLALAIISIVMLIRGVEGGSNRDLWTGLILGLLATFVRQTGIAIFLGYLVALPFHDGLRRRWFVTGLVPTLIVFGSLIAYKKMLIALGQLPDLYDAQAVLTAAMIQSIVTLKFGVLRILAWRTLVLLLHVGLFSFPVLILIARSLLRGTRTVRLARAVWIVGFSASASYYLWRERSLMPFLGNVVEAWGVGPVLLAGASPAGMPVGLRLTLTVISAVGGALWVLLLVDALLAFLRPGLDAPSRRWRLVFFAGFIALNCAVTVVNYAPIYDRYLLPIVTMSIVMAVSMAHANGSPPGRPAFVASGVVLAIFLLFSVAATRDYLVLNRARWELLTDLVERQRVSPQSIDGGFEFNNLASELESYQRSGQFARKTRARGQIARDPSHGRGFYEISLSPRAGATIVRRLDVQVWFPYSPPSLFVLQDNAPGT
ncbi:MAG: hypothetical protein JWN86_2665 [Planctomycetota bacterium]|nr:hypothetical protein [Planctomycetota bacterium]